MSARYSISQITIYSKNPDHCDFLRYAVDRIYCCDDETKHHFLQPENSQTRAFEAKHLSCGESMRLTIFPFALLQNRGGTSQSKFHINKK
jgi:hypothetical protein